MVVSPEGGSLELQALSIAEDAEGLVARTLTSADAAVPSLIDALPVAVYVTDSDGRITYYNEAATALWGCRPELGSSEFCGSWRLFHPDGTPMRHDECPMAQALREGRPVRGKQAIAERPDGTRVPFLPYPTPLFDSAGVLVGAVNTLVDLSERRQWEMSLAKRMEEQAALFRFTDRLYRAGSLSDVYSASLDAIIHGLGCDRASILLFDDASIMRFVAWRGLSEGYRRAVEGHSPWSPDTQDPQPIQIEDIERAELPESLRATLRKEGIAALAFVPLVVSGKLAGKFMTYCDVPRVFSEGDVDLSVTIARQLGFSLERMAAGDSQRRAEQEAILLGSIVEETDDAIISRDLRGIITSWNRGAERLFGYLSEEAIGRSVTMLMPPGHKNEEPTNLERIRRGERVDHYETVRMHKDGSLIDISLTLSPIKDASGRIVGASKIARDIRDRKRAEARQELLTQEIHHRTKNIFSVVQAVVTRSFAGKRTVAEAESSVLSRLQSLAQTHQILVEKEWRGAELADVIRAEMRPYQGRLTIEGPSILLNARATQDFALFIHELATNAAKYGALSNSTGRVQIGWSVDGGASPPTFTFRWQEQGGPTVAVPARKGFGSVVMEHVMASYSDTPSRVHFAPDGVIYELRTTLTALTA